MLPMPPAKPLIYSKVVKLEGNGHVCSGEQVQAPSGESYILTAGHCSALADKDGIITAIDDNKDYHKVRVVAEDPKSDLLLLDGISGLEGIKVAKRREMNQHVRTFTHGANRDTYETDGVLLWDEHVMINTGKELASEEDVKACVSQPKFGLAMSLFGMICVLSVTETVTSAYITGGSSGGAVISDSGELVGVVSAGDGKIGLLVTLSDIHDFLRLR